jgi:hypothetical protein
LHSWCQGCDIGIQQFTEQRRVGNIHVFFQLGMFGGLFRRASRCGVQCDNSGSRKRFGGTRTTFGFRFAGGFPVVTSEETAEVWGARQFEIISTTTNWNY